KHDGVFTGGVVGIHEFETIHRIGYRNTIARADSTFCDNAKDIFRDCAATIMLINQDIYVSGGRTSSLLHGWKYVSLLQLLLVIFLTKIAKKRRSLLQCHWV